MTHREAFTIIVDFIRDQESRGTELDKPMQKALKVIERKANRLQLKYPAKKKMGNN